MINLNFYWKTVWHHYRFFNFRKKRVLNGQYSSWTSIEAGLPQGSILRPLLILIYINDLSDGLITNVKLFADNASLFSIVHNMNKFATNLNNDLNKINNWAIQWKMNLTSILVNRFRRLCFPESFKRQILINFISVTTPLNKFLLKNILECLLILKWIFKNT